MPLETEYRFETEEGTRTLAELFNGRPQLVVYHFMFGPGYTAGCPTCSATADSFNGVLPHLEAADVTMICISRAPLEKLLAYRRRRAWSFNWASSYENDFNIDFGVFAAEDVHHEAAPLLEANEVAARPLLRDQAVSDSLPPVAKYNADATGTDAVGYFAEGHGVSGFAREGDSVYHCYSGYARGTEFLMSNYAILDRTPRGREPADAIGSWVRRHDEQALAASDAHVTRRLAALVRRQLINPHGPQLTGEDGFRFRHLLIRDAAYESLTKTSRAELHQRFAAWLEQRGQDLVELDELLGFHLEQAARYKAELGQTDAGLAEQASEHLAAAGRRAL